MANYGYNNGGYGEGGYNFFMIGEPAVVVAVSVARTISQTMTATRLIQAIAVCSKQADLNQIMPFARLLRATVICAKQTTTLMNSGSTP
jgi:hypothetical protein